MSTTKTVLTGRNQPQKPPIQRKKSINPKNQKINPALIQKPVSKRNPSTITPVNQIVIKQTYYWQKWDSILIEVGTLPMGETTYNLWKNFSRFGTVSHVEIYDSQGRRNRRGKIRFTPPPAVPFWPATSRRFLIGCTSEDEAHRYFVDVQPKMSDPMKIQSPINKNIYYNPTMKLKAASLHFGIMISPGSVMSLATVNESITLSLDLRRYQVTVNFSFRFRDPRHDGKKLDSKTEIGTYDRVNKYMFQIPFSQLKSIQRKEHDSTTDLLVISLDYPPRFFRKREDSRVGHSTENLRWEEFDTWFRQTDIMYDPYPLHRQKVALHKETPDIDIGRWTTYVFRAEKPSDLVKQALSDFNINIVDLDNLSYVLPKRAVLWSVIDSPDYSETSQDLRTLDEGSDAIISLPFEVRYQLEVCISREILNEYNVSREFIQTLANLASKNPLKAQSILEYIVGKGDRIYDPMSIFQDREIMAFTTETDIPHYCAFVRKAIITPTTIYFNSPTVETTNRVLRRYARENRDGRFLRVQFTDELSQGRINPCAEKSKDDELYTRVYRTLFNGIQIGDRTYEFLAFGGSQFRENGAYFFCPTEHLSCDDIRQWMGNFSHIPVVAKYAARLGQCFSTTRAINGLSKPDIVLLPDIEREYNDGVVKSTYCFTDGVGKISPFLAQMITVELGIRTKNAPSAFQFRLGGCKGILVVWPEAKEKEVHIRKSQQKFTAVYNGLEIIRCSRFSIATLNRQTITILSTLGVEDDVFIQMLSDQLESYQNAMEHDDLAVNLLLRYIDDNHMTINIATMIRNGFMTQKDPFVISLLHLWRAWSIKLLKEKARIIVENGAFLFGCVDETGTLKGYTKPDVSPGQNPEEKDLPEIFIQVPDKDDPEQYKIIVGLCFIGRNPSLHPGDLRVVRAVDNPLLRHLRDVVVLPSTGDRDIASMCSGGDLDGDDYFVIWDERLIPKQWNNEPMNYSAPEPRKLNQPVQITDLMKFFVRYMKNDALRTIAPAHLANSDYLSRGVKDPICLELAALHSKAVDYVKSGEAAQMPTRLRPKKWPHFMEKNHKPKDFQYHSTKILGKIYDRVERVNFIPQWEEPFDKRILQRYELDSNILEVAREIKSQYDLGMRKIMNQQEIGTEFEIWTTFVLSKPRVGSDYKIHEVVAEISDALKEQYRSLCIEKAGGKDFDVLGPFVAAMYQVTKEELDAALSDCRSTHVLDGREEPVRVMEPKSMPLISFPWLFEKELGRIATGINADPRGNLGLELLTLGDIGSRKRYNSALQQEYEEDVILNEDGKIIRRGEMLNLFSENDTENEVRKTTTTGIDSQEILVSDAAETKIKDALAAGTGVEDVVPQKALDGLIDLRSMKPVHVSNSKQAEKSPGREENNKSKDQNPRVFDLSFSNKITNTPMSNDQIDKATKEEAEEKKEEEDDDDDDEVEEVLIMDSNPSKMDQLIEMYGSDMSDSDAESI
ncbi:RNA-dependent RNA polymerase 1 [Golovinomyces cichoracearum]|uniref:RNA-dependent RNA polymerase n=1 Tax=Golovinomyces cichoracearum TaxID=62708 RepID=A0A420JBJ6_9PEZI|nr:RNA-dependent RNA polymerase 1 [Golovinomyces cichoracearum]